MFFRRKSSSSPNIRSVRFDTFGWAKFDQKPGIIVWRQARSKDIMSLNFFDVPPDIPYSLSQPEQLEADNLRRARESDGQLVEFEVGQIQSIPALKVIFRLPRLRDEVVYVASWTLPFAAFSYVIKVQSYEGMEAVQAREDAVVEWAIREGRIDDPADHVHEITGWAEHPNFDEHLPGHGLSRARRFLQQAVDTIEMDADVRDAPHFTRPK